MKYITYVRDTRFTAQRQLMIVDLIHDGSRGILTNMVELRALMIKVHLTLAFLEVMGNYNSSQLSSR